MNDCGLRGLALLDAAIAQIEAHPETWEQATWRCETGMCVAGWVCELAGGRWLAGPADVAKRSLLVPDPDDDPDFARAGRISASSRARRLLGCEVDNFDDDDRDVAWDLFDAHNDLAEIKYVRNQLVERGEIS